MWDLNKYVNNTFWAEVEWLSGQYLCTVPKHHIFLWENIDIKSFTGD